MSRQLIFAIAAGSALSGCCLGSGYYIPPPGAPLPRWEGAGLVQVHNIDPPQAPNNGKAEKAPRKSAAVASEDESLGEAKLIALKKYSEEWWSVRDAIDRAAEVRLTKKLVICRDCMPSTPEDATASITPK
jgi:hypothetical protein